MEHEFSWGSTLGIGVLLFLGGVVVHLVIGLLTPLFIDTPTGSHYLFMSERTDASLYGPDPARLLDEVPALRGLRLTLITVIAGLLIALGIAEIALAWFGLRSGQSWALAALAIAGLAMLPVWFLVLRPYLAAGPVGLGDLPPFMWVPAATLLPAVVLSWIGLR